MKTNFKTIFYIWLIHIVSYYTIFGLIYQYLVHYFHTALTVNIETVGKVRRARRDPRHVRRVDVGRSHREPGPSGDRPRPLGQEKV